MKAATVKVWNRNSFDHKEKFKGSIIEIPAHKFIEMDYDEAVLFRGQFFNPQFGKDMVQKPESYKWIEIDPEDRAKVLKERASDGGESDVEKIFPCHVCAKEFRTKNGLLKHIKDKHQDIMVDKDARDELLDNEDLE
jgi:hypothetical protein